MMTRFVFALTLAACGGADAGPEVPDDPVDLEPEPQTPLPKEEPEKTVFDGLDQGRVVLMKLGPPGSAFPGLPGVDPALVQQTLDMLIKQGALPPGLLPPLLGTAQLRGRWTVLREQVVEKNATRERLIEILRDRSSFIAAPDCFTGDHAIHAQRAEGEPIDIVLDSQCKTVDSFGVFWPHKHRGLTEAAYAELTAIFDEVLVPRPPPVP